MTLPFHSPARFARSSTLVAPRQPREMGRWKVNRHGGRRPGRGGMDPGKELSPPPPPKLLPSLTPPSRGEKMIPLSPPTFFSRFPNPPSIRNRNPTMRTLAGAPAGCRAGPDRYGLFRPTRPTSGGLDATEIHSALPILLPSTCPACSPGRAIMSRHSSRSVGYCENLGLQRVWI